MTKDRWVTGVVSPDFPHARLVGDFNEDPGVTHGLKDLFQGHNVTQQRGNLSKKLVGQFTQQRLYYPAILGGGFKHFSLSLRKLRIHDPF